ncbi:hypothetical protein Tco_0902016, partial [Tanacetum coccineum]
MSTTTGKTTFLNTLTGSRSGRVDCFLVKVYMAFTISIKSQLRRDYGGWSARTHFGQHGFVVVLKEGNNLLMNFETKIITGCFSTEPLFVDHPLEVVEEVVFKWFFRLKVQQEDGGAWGQSQGRRGKTLYKREVVIEGRGLDTFEPSCACCECVENTTPILSLGLPLCQVLNPTLDRLGGKLGLPHGDTHVGGVGGGVKDCEGFGGLWQRQRWVDKKGCGVYGIWRECFGRDVQTLALILVSVGCQKPGHLAARLGCAETKVATWDDLAFKLSILRWNVKHSTDIAKISRKRLKPAITNMGTELSVQKPKNAIK